MKRLATEAPPLDSVKMRKAPTKAKQEPKFPYRVPVAANGELHPIGVTKVEVQT